MVLPLSGPDFWDQQFGIASFEEFRPLAERYLGGFGVFGIQLPTEALAQLAYNAPYSALGTYLGGRIAASGYTGTDQEQSTSDVVTLTQPFVIGNLLQESAAMPGLIIADCFQVTIQGLAGGRAIDNVIGVRNAGGTAAGAAAAVKAAWEMASGPLSTLANLYSVPNYHAVDIRSSTGSIVDLSSTAVGGRAQSFSTRGAAALVKWNGGSRARSTRGRLYLGPIAEVDINADGATLTSAQQASFTTAFTNFRNSLNTAGYPLVVLSRTLGTATTVTTHAVEGTIATQRRRIRS